MTIQTKELTQDLKIIILTDEDGEHPYLSYEGEMKPLLDYDHRDDILLLHTEDYTLQLDYSF